MDSGTVSAIRKVSVPSSGVAPMLGIGDKLPSFEITGVKPGFNNHVEGGASASKRSRKRASPASGRSSSSTRRTSPSCAPTEIAEVRASRPGLRGPRRGRARRLDRQRVRQVAWRREHKDLNKLPIWQFRRHQGFNWSTASASRSPAGVATATRSSSTRTTRSSTSTRPTSTSAATRRTRCASSTRCRPTSCARATAKSAATRLKAA